MGKVDWGKHLPLRQVKRIVKNLNEIDEPIKDIIIQMNKKGYKTLYSCAGYNYSGHIANEIGKHYKLVPKPYIVFKSSLKNARKLREVLEYGWTIELSHYNTYFLSYPSEKSEKSRKQSWGYLRKCLTKLKK